MGVIRAPHAVIDTPERGVIPSGGKDDLQVAAAVGMITVHDAFTDGLRDNGQRSGILEIDHVDHFLTRTEVVRQRLLHRSESRRTELLTVKKHLIAFHAQHGMVYPETGMRHGVKRGHDRLRLPFAGRDAVAAEETGMMWAAVVSCEKHGVESPADLGIQVVEKVRQVFVQTHISVFDFHRVHPPAGVPAHRLRRNSP